MANTTVSFTLQLGRWRHQDNLGFTKADLNDIMLQNSCVVCNFSHTTDLNETCPFLQNGKNTVKTQLYLLAMSGWIT